MNEGKEHFKIFIYSLFLFFSTDKITVTFFFVKGLINYNNLVLLFIIFKQKKPDNDEELKPVFIEIWQSALSTMC